MLVKALPMDTSSTAVYQWAIYKASVASHRSGEGVLAASSGVGILHVAEVSPMHFE